MKIIELTDEQATALRMFLLISSGYRCGEATASKELGTELNEDGTFVFPNMKANGEWWEKTNKRLEDIENLLDA